jgi:hypothetical protein
VALYGNAQRAADCSRVWDLAPFARIPVEDDAAYGAADEVAAFAPSAGSDEVR